MNLPILQSEVKTMSSREMAQLCQKGYGEMKQSDAGFDQALFTQKGQAWVIEQLTSEGVV